MNRSHLVTKNLGDVFVLNKSTEKLFRLSVISWPTKKGLDTNTKLVDIAFVELLKLMALFSADQT